jgi:hypothetical protein
MPVIEKSRPWVQLERVLTDPEPAVRAYGARDFLERRPMETGWEGLVVKAYKDEPSYDAKGLMGCSMGFYANPRLVDLLIKEFKSGKMTDTLVIISEATRCLYDPRTKDRLHNEGLFRRSADLIIGSMDNQSPDIQRLAIVSARCLFGKWHIQEANETPPFSYRRHELVERLRNFEAQGIFPDEARKSLREIT